LLIVSVPFSICENNQTPGLVITPTAGQHRQQGNDEMEVADLSVLLNYELEGGGLLQLLNYQLQGGGLRRHLEFGYLNKFLRKMAKTFCFSYFFAIFASS